MRCGETESERGGKRKNKKKERAEKVKTIQTKKGLGEIEEFCDKGKLKKEEGECVSTKLRVLYYFPTSPLSLSVCFPSVRQKKKKDEGCHRRVLFSRVVYVFERARFFFFLSFE